jgi:peptide/nickel transport system substrate-binding protein
MAFRGSGLRRLAHVLAGCSVLALVVLVPAAARTSRYGGVLVVGLSRGDVDTLDPTVSQTFSPIVIYPAMCETLYRSVPNHGLPETVPQLAASLPQISTDRLRYTVQLRKGILFNDGTPLNAQAVVTSVNRFITYPGSTRTSTYVDVASVEAAGPYTVVFHLKSRDSTFVTQSTFVLSPTALATEGANFAADPICVGAFMFDHRVVGDNVTLVKSPYYYDSKDVYLDKIVFKPEPDAAAAVAALQAGDIQALDNVSTTQVSAVQASSSLRLIQRPNLGWGGIVINIGNRSGVGNLPYAADVGTPLSQSPLLRQAFEEAIDRTTLNRVVFGGLYQPSCTPVAPPSSWFQATKVPCTPYDPADAKKLIARAGFSNPTVHLLTNNNSDFLRLAQFIQAQEAAVGINVVIDPEDATTAQTLARAGSFDAYLTSFFSGSNDPHNNIFPFLDSAGPRNLGGYSNRRLDYVLANGLKATEMKPRAVNYHVAEEIIAADRPAVYLYNQVTFAAYSSSLAGITLSPGGILWVANARYR